MNLLVVSKHACVVCSTDQRNIDYLLFFFGFLADNISFSGIARIKNYTDEYGIVYHCVRFVRSHVKLLLSFQDKNHLSLIPLL